MSAGKYPLEKGKYIHFTGGQDISKKEWMNTAVPTTACYYYIVVNMGKGEEIVTKVRQNNVGSALLQPTTFKKATFKQFDEMNKTLEKLHVSLQLGTFVPNISRTPSFISPRVGSVRQTSNRQS